MNVPNGALAKDVIYSIFHSRWIYAVPMPVFFALSGTLVGKWFSRLDEAAVIAANFIVSAVILIPSTLLIIYINHDNHLPTQPLSAILLLLIGTLASSAAGRVFYQVALTRTDNDNGFVTMFFLLIPVISSLISIPLSLWISDLRVAVGPLFVTGMLFVTTPLLLFSIRSLRHSGPHSGELGET